MYISLAQELLNNVFAQNFFFGPRNRAFRLHPQAEQEMLLEKGLLPGVITKYGPNRA